MAAKRKFSEFWRGFVKSERFRKIATFLIFVVIAAIFWYVLALNDSVQDTLDVRLNVDNVPDSVTFINDPPEVIHVTVRDKGTALLRNGLISKATVSLNFKDHADGGVFHVSGSELSAAIKSAFGGSAALLSSSVDSLRCVYTTLPGKRVPVVVAADLTAASGKVINSVSVLPGSVMVYSSGSISDTISRVYTQKVLRRNLEEPSTFTVDLHPVAGARLEPSTVTLNVNVEALVKKESVAQIKVENAPENVDLLLFPARVKVEYYLPMSKFGDAGPEIDVWVDYRDIDPTRNTLPVHIGQMPAYVANPTVAEPEIEYVIAHE